MDFNLTKEQEMIQKMMRKFSETEVAPIAEELDVEAKFPFSSVEKLGKLGVMGMPFPAEYGGAGADYIAYIIAIEELSKVCGSHGVIVQTHNALCCWPIFTYGTEEQKRKYLPDLLSGRKLGAFGLTEPNAGTDAA
ncbi:MAG TPA: acyl-CoA dehydrogenase family protein, partial [Anaerovoracaceae bacterium]|nr:acyl-CoA dehydrogenase family protein [Anaerovoracaceae bacterium]